MKVQPSQDDDAILFEEETDDLEAWTPQDLDQFGSFGASPWLPLRRADEVH